MLKKSILSVVVIIVCLSLFTGCDKKAVEQMQSELDQVKATLDKTQAELDAAKIKLQEAEKWKQEYDKLYVVNQNLEGQIQALKKLMTQLQKNIKSDKDTIKELQQKLQE